MTNSMALVEQLKLAIGIDNFTMDGLRDTAEKLHTRLNNLVVDCDKKDNLSKVFSTGLKNRRSNTKK